MDTYYRAGKTICSHLRSRGYNIKFKQEWSWLTFTLDGKFLFCTTVDILPENEIEKIILELLEEKENVRVPSKDRKQG